MSQNLINNNTTKTRTTSYAPSNPSSFNGAPRQFRGQTIGCLLSYMNTKHVHIMWTSLSIERVANGTMNTLRTVE